MEDDHESLTRPVRFGRYAVELPAQWLVQADDRLLLAVLPDDDEVFASTITMTSAPGDDDLTAGAAALAGSVLLSVGRFDGAFPAAEVVFGYPFADAAVTAVQLFGDPGPDGRLVVTFSAEARHFPAHWPPVRDALRTLEVTA